MTAEADHRLKVAVEAGARHGAVCLPGCSRYGTLVGPAPHPGPLDYLPAFAAATVQPRGTNGPSIFSESEAPKKYLDSKLGFGVKR